MINLNFTEISDQKNQMLETIGYNLWRLEFSPNPDEDTKNYRHVNNPAARQEVLKLIDEDN